MAEPENYMLRLLRELRDKFRAYRAEFSEFRADVKKKFHAVNERMEHLAQMLAGEIVTRSHAAAAVDQKLASIDQRLSAIERARG